MTVSNCSVSDIFPGYEQIIFIDVETTGLSVDENQIIELAAVRRYEYGAEAEEKSIDLLVRLPPGEKIPEEIVELTHITDDMLESEGMEESEAVDRFSEIFNPAEKTLIVAHNAQFDLSFILKMLEKFGKSIPVSFDILDTFTILKDRKAYPHSLKEAIEYYQIEGVENSHRAIDDVKALCEVVSHMKTERDDLEDYINLIGVHRIHGLWGEKISGVSYCIQLLGSKRKRLPDFLKEGKRIYEPEKVKETRPLNFRE
ncbi:DNA polymerase III PolC-type [Methanimicrococcus sp. At1]|uniref:DNA polymerase III PolC-type n=1 Tax=Methanimicrococcus hacksteinii TaxID=3028293 RepID=A0ABU3VP41_9EURY|nr:3'-5' exonuclease [Methanimicrococcus sp. At1]MDV0445189.1 DNA polymerase III PolC-type [Methanimicrococcus sp. At1]